MKISRLRKLLTCLLALVLLPYGHGATIVTTAQDKNQIRELKLTQLDENYGEELTKNRRVYAHNKLNDGEYADEEVTVIVELKDQTLLDSYLEEAITDVVESDNLKDYLTSDEAKLSEHRLITEQNQVRKQIESELETASKIELLYQYTTVINGFALRVSYDQASSIQFLDAVKSIYIAPVCEQPDTETLTDRKKESELYTQVSFEGQGIVIAVIDTGLDTTHEAFQSEVSWPRLTEAEINKVVSALPINADINSASDTFVNSKIPFAYDYADHDTDVNPTAESIAVGNNHGTHVAGIIGAETDIVEGIATEAQLLILKVYDDNKGNAKMEDVLAALEDSISLGADVINMSIGTAAGFTDPENDVIKQIYDKVVAAGINLSVAAGNNYSSSYNNGLGYSTLTSNPDTAVINSPSTYSTATSVASISSSGSYFSSWGADPNLNIKPEISALGENTLSTAPNNEYMDVTGTSVASAQVAGAYGLLREYLNKHPKLNRLSQIEKGNIATSLLMSTAEPAINEAGVYYSPRKQGSGVFNIQNALNTSAYLYTKEPGNHNRLKPKLNLYDDPKETGVFSSSFHISNISDQDITYTIKNESLADNIITSDEVNASLPGITLSEDINILSESSCSVSEYVYIVISTAEGIVQGNDLNVKANSDVEISVTFILKPELVDYYKTNFINGGFFEGYIKLNAHDEQIELSIPYMGFYGDWTKSPLFDSGSVYDRSIFSQTFHVAYTNGGNAYLGINPFDEYAYMYLNNKYNPLFMMSDYEENTLYPDPNKIAISPNGDGNFDMVNSVHISQLRNARNLLCKITDQDNKVVLEQSFPYVRKSLFNANYGTVKPTMIDASFYGKGYQNNSIFCFTVTGVLDYDRHESNNLKDSFSIPITIDTEEPIVKKALLKTTGEKTLLTLTVSDNQYVSYISLYKKDREGTYQIINEQLVNESQKNMTTYIELEMEDYDENTYLNGDILIIIYDYAMNENNYSLQGIEKETKLTDKYFGDGYEVDFSIDSQWNGTFNGSIIIVNTSDEMIDNWALEFYMDHKISSIWNAKLQACHDGRYIIKNNRWNQDIPIGGKVSFGFCATYKERIHVPEEYSLVNVNKVIAPENYQISYRTVYSWDKGFMVQIDIINRSQQTIEDWMLDC